MITAENCLNHLSGCCANRVVIMDVKYMLQFMVQTMTVQIISRYQIYYISFHLSSFLWSIEGALECLRMTSVLVKESFLNPAPLRSSGRFVV